VTGSTSGRSLPDDWILPAVDEHNEAYFTSGELLLERCPACGHVQHPPQGVCVACQHVGTERVAVEPVGTVVSATVVHHALNPMLRDRVPYDVVVVELRDHPHVRIVGNVLGVAGGRVAIGTAVRGSWTGPLGERSVRLLQWTPVPGAG
jgi:uncharacterized OB-fold protein